MVTIGRVDHGKATLTAAVSTIETVKFDELTEFNDQIAAARGIAVNTPAIG